VKKEASPIYMLEPMICKSKRKGKVTTVIEGWGTDEDFKIWSEKK
jgi:hypothetical protein